jgi:CHAT domain-containing protein
VSGWWQLARRLIVLLIVLVSCGCGHSGHPATGHADPQVLLQSISSDFLRGDLEIARARADAARTTSAAAGDPTWEVQFRLLEADILLRENRAQDVVSLLIQAGVAIPTQGDPAIKHNWLCGLAHSRLGQAAAAERELQAARRLADASHSALMGEVLRAEGLVARDAGQLDEATEKFKSSLAIAQQSHNLLLEVTDLVDIGYDNHNSGHFDQAILSDQAAADFARTVHASRHLQLALGNMGWAYQNLGDFERALANFQEAERVAQQIGMTRNRVLWLEDAGLAEYRLGDLAQARQYDEQALQSAHSLPATAELHEVVNIETNLALLLYEQDQFTAARSYSDAAVLTARDSKDNDEMAYAGLAAGLLAARSTNAEDAERKLLAARLLSSDPDFRTDVDDALANLYAGTHRSRQAEQWYRQAIHTFEAKRSGVTDEGLRLGAFGYGDAVYRDYAGFLVDGHRQAAALHVLDRSRARTLEEGLGFAAADARTQDHEIADAQAVARRLDASILFYSLGRERSYLWAITPHETHLLLLPPARQIESLVESHQRAIQKSNDLLQATPPGEVSLYDALIAPAAALLANGSKVFVIPDGVLHALNFETLLEPTASGRRYLIEHFTITTASSIGMLSRWQPIPENAADQDLLLIGDPIAAQGEFAALANAATEVRDVRQHFAQQGQTVLTQAQAVPAAYAASRPEQFQYIHFVAHGTASRLSPLESAVVLSPPPNSPQDFKLYARDIVQHRLNAKLVTISACYGSGARTYAGEGLVGLAWAFLRAGSHNVIGTLWQADDASTPLLMDRLYGELQAGKTPDVALRDAKLTLVHSANVYRKPFYWGAFQLYAGS